MSETGKQWRGQKHAPLITEDQAKEQFAIGAEFSSKPNAISLNVYLAGKGIRDQTRIAMMEAHAPKGVKTAPKEDWDKFFEDF